MDLEGRNRVISALQHYEKNPQDFCQEILGVTLDHWQAQAAQALVDKKFLAIRSGSGVGKSFLLSAMICWFLATKPFCRVPCTAPSQHQLFDILWAEVFEMIQKSKFLTNMLEWTQTTVRVKGYGPSWYAVARTASVSPDGSVAEGLSGFHSKDNLLFIVDEASGVSDAVFPAVEGALTGENAYCILASNPTRLQGYYYDIFHRRKTGERYQKIHISCHNSARVTQQYLDRMEERYGRDHPIYKIKVDGDFPDQDEGFLIPYSHIQHMENNNKETVVSKLMPIEIGIDMGRTKAASVACIRQGYNILDYVEKRRYGNITETNELTQWVVGLINEWKPQLVKIDALNIGMGVCDNLVDIYPFVIPIVGQAKSSDTIRYMNLRAEGYYTLAETIPKLWCKSWPDRVITELGDLRKKTSPSGRHAVESKIEMRKRCLKSPDYADATMYAFINTETEMGEELIPVGDFLRKNLDMMRQERSKWTIKSNLHGIGAQRWRSI